MVNEDALRQAIEIAGRHLPAAILQPTRSALSRLDTRARFNPERTVVALIGATGSGKSSLVNAVVGQDVTRVAAIRPTTSRARAIVYGGGAEQLLDWLEIAERTELPGAEGLILLDLPDVDSVETGHRAITSRLAEAVDVLVWVLDPEKYADAVIHREFIEPFATHGEVAFAVVNQVDRISDDDRSALIQDVARLFGGYGLSGEILATSARTGDGIPELRERIVAIAESRSARVARAEADVRRAAIGLADSVSGAPADTSLDSAPLSGAASRAAGADVVEKAVYGSVQRGGRAAVGWPVTRWLSRFRADPLRRLHLDRDLPADLTRTSLPPPSLIQESAVRTEAQRLVDSTTAGMPAVWRDSIMTAMDDRVDAVVGGLDRAIVGTDLGAAAPHWWRVVGWLQWLLVGMAAAGALWLAGLGVLRYLALPTPEAPMIGEIPLPTAMLIGGLALGFLLALVCMFFVRRRARRVSRRAVRRLRESVAAMVDERFAIPLRDELAEWNEFRTLLG